jgi:hypothetical protein
VQDSGAPHGCNRERHTYDLYPVFLSGQAGLQAFPAGMAAVLGGLSLNRIFWSKDSLLPLLRKSQKYET